MANYFKMTTLLKNNFINRDLSWLSFNERVLLEAADKNVPLLERIKFLSIYSSNLDEFYRVRMPVIQALKKLNKKGKIDLDLQEGLLSTVYATINKQLELFGTILKEDLLPQLKSNGINFIYNKPLPSSITEELSNYFLSQMLSYIQMVDVSAPNCTFFPENNYLYFLVKTKCNGIDNYTIINIPSNQIPRFYTTNLANENYVIFIDDIISANLPLLFRGQEVISCHSFKITRDAEIDLKDEYGSDMADLIEKQLLKRDLGLATRLLHSPEMDEEMLNLLIEKLDIRNASVVAGGKYHNLKDLADFPVKNANLSNSKWPKINYPPFRTDLSLIDLIIEGDLLLNPPYQSYDSVLRFFNEGATAPYVTEIYTTLYRVANDSKIVNALITAAKNGKKVTVLVELKARFDEANNIKWAKKMKAAGVNIIYSITALKVHAKVALIKRTKALKDYSVALFATGNFNEVTANFYTDHILMTANAEMLKELELLFIFLAKKEKPTAPLPIDFKQLLVAQFNLQSSFLSLIEQEIENAKQGKKAAITIKLNNLEEEVMINKLYDAAIAGVEIKLIIRGICRLIPQQNITIRRIVDRYLEHGRIFLFHNNGEEKMYLGSADWMNRNIYRRIEVCFPILNIEIKEQLKQLLTIQLTDNTKAVLLDESLKNTPITNSTENVQSQYEIYKYLQDCSKND